MLNILKDKTAIAMSSFVDLDSVITTFLITPNSKFPIRISGIFSNCILKKTQGTKCTGWGIDKPIVVGFFAFNTSIDINQYMPREWFLVPLFVIDEAVEMIKDGTISGYVYDPQGACLKLRRED